MREAIDDLKVAFFNYDRLFVVVGDSKFTRLELAEGMKNISNEERPLGGIKLWQDVDERGCASEC